MSEKKLRRLPLAAAAMVACMSAQADYQSPDGNFRLSGFGTLGAVKTTTNDAIYGYPGQGGGATKHGSLDPDSKIAVQGTYKFAPTVSATSQVMTKYDADGQYIPNINWAFAKWQAMPGLSFRAGRMGAPLFMISDFRDVGYANTFVRPPLDVYGQVPISQFEGLDAAYQFNAGEATITSTFWTGDSKSDYASSLARTPSQVILKRSVGLNVLAELSNGWSLRVGRSQGKMTVKSELADQLTAGAQGATLAGGYAAFIAGAGNGAFAGIGGPAAVAAAQASRAQMAQVASLLNVEGVKATFTGIGLAYDQDNWVGSLEFTKRKTDSYVSDTTGWYSMVGYRVDRFTPYIGLSKIKSDRRSSNPVSASALRSSAVVTNSGGSSSPLYAGAVALDTGVNNVYGGINAVLGTQKQDERTMTVGVRWDATSSLAVKAQFDRVTKPADSQGMFLIADPTTASSTAFMNNKRSVNVMTLSVDFVF